MEKKILINPDRVEVEKEHFASGATARVYNGVIVDDANEKQKVAIKEYVVNMSRRMQKKFDKEASILQTLFHPNVLRFYGRIDRSSKLVTEYLEKVVEVDGEATTVNSLRQLLDEVEDNLPWSVRLQIVIETAKGLKYLHDSNCLHCDLKSANVFIGGGTKDEWVVKIGDFGEARAEFKEYMTTQVSSSNPDDIAGGTIPYIAPELLKGKNSQSKKSDVYSFAMLLIELLFPDRSNPWSHDCRSLVIMQNVLGNKRPTLPDSHSDFPSPIYEKLKRVVKNCWDTDPTKRPSSGEILLELSSIADKGDTESEKKQDREQKDEDDICVLVDVNDEPGYCNETQYAAEDIELITLSCHQGAALETFSDIAASFVETGRNLPGTMLKAMAYDGTNCCAFLSLVINDWLQKNTHKNVQEMKIAFEQIITELPKKINIIRDVSAHFSVDEAANKLKIADIIHVDTEPVIECYSEVASAEGEQAIMEGLEMLKI